LDFLKSLEAGVGELEGEYLALVSFGTLGLFELVMLES